MRSKAIGVIGRIWLAFVLGLGGASVRAQPSGGRTTQLNETVELARLIDLCSQRLSLNIEYDARLSGSATLRIRSELSDAELWILANRLLAARGYTTIRMGDDGTLSVVQISAALGLARVETPEALAADAGPGAPGFRVVLVPVRGRRTEDLAAALQPLLSKAGGSVTAFPESRSVLLADLTPRLELAMRTLDALEHEASSDAPVEIRVTNLPAGQLVTLLKQLAAMGDAAGVAERRGELLPGPDDRSILVVAPEQELAQRRELIAGFDRREAVETVSYTPGGFRPARLPPLLSG